METTLAFAALIQLALLQVKHAIFDGPLQHSWMLREKGFYGKPGGIVHAGLHGLGTFAALGILGVDIFPMLALAAADAFIHYHVDYIKETMVRRNGWTVEQPYFWWALSTDQLIHQFTYLGIAAALVMWV